MDVGPELAALREGGKEGGKEGGREEGWWEGRKGRRTALKEGKKIKEAEE